MKKKTLLIGILLIILFLTFKQMTRIPFPKQGKYIYNDDPNCVLILDEYTYRFEGEGDNYEDVVYNFKKKGEIIKIENYRDYFDMYLITNDSHGPYIQFEEDGSIIFSMGISYSDSYKFYELDE